jgi:uncharacterized integral membrane protein (TIGR00698 family)
MNAGPSVRISTGASTAILAVGLLVCTWPVVTGAEALILGLMVGLAGLNQWTAKTTAFASRLLQISIVGLGAGMNLAVIWAVGLNSIGYTIAGIILTLSLGLWLGKRNGLSQNLALLISCGTAICGGSAIAAVACVLRPREEETTAALATVFLLNAVGLLLFPALGHAFGFSQHDFGMWAALAIHDTSSVVGAGATYGETALRTATTVKLTRAIWIVPLTLAIAWAMARSRKQMVPPPPRIKFPLFIAGFLATAALTTYWPAFAGIAPSISSGAKRLLVMALFLVGANLSRPALRAVGWKPLTVGITLWITISSLVAGAIKLGWIN